jgi:hypothetical protein
LAASADRALFFFFFFCTLPSRPSATAWAGIRCSGAAADHHGEAEESGQGEQACATNRISLSRSDSSSQVQSSATGAGTAVIADLHTLAVPSLHRVGRSHREKPQCE